MRRMVFYESADPPGDAYGTECEVQERELKAVSELF